MVDFFLFRLRLVQVHELQNRTDSFKIFIEKHPQCYHFRRDIVIKIIIKIVTKIYLIIFLRKHCEGAFELMERYRYRNKR